MIIENNDIGAEGAKALAEALKLNNNLTSLRLGKYLPLFKFLYKLLQLVNSYSKPLFYYSKKKFTIILQFDHVCI